MKTIRQDRFGTIAGFLSLVLLFAPAPVWGGKGGKGGDGGGSPAAPPPITGADICGNPVIYPPDGDYDFDGFTNFEECVGLSKGNNGPYLTIPGYEQMGSEPRSDYLDPSTKDVFVWFESLTQPTLEDVSIYTSGLGAAVHLIGPGDMGSDIPGDVFSLYRAITASGSNPNYPKQKADKITEDLDPTLYDSNGDPLELGIANWGTPNGPDETIVFVGRIQGTVAEKCGPYQTCEDVGGIVGIGPVGDHYTRHVRGHEMGHQSKLTRTIDAAGEHHYAAESFSVMEKSIAAKLTSRKNGGTFTFYISTTYTDPDKTDAVMTGY